MVFLFLRVPHHKPTMTTATTTATTASMIMMNGMGWVQKVAYRNYFTIFLRKICSLLCSNSALFNKVICSRHLQVCVIVYITIVISRTTSNTLFPVRTVFSFVRIVHARSWQPKRKTEEQQQELHLHTYVESRWCCYSRPQPLPWRHGCCLI